MSLLPESEGAIGPVPEAPMERDEHGALRASGPGWFVLNVADAVWRRDNYSTATGFQGDERFRQYGFNLDVLRPGTPSTSYHREHWEDESFFVLEGECVLLVEGAERTMRAGDFFHCPAGTAHAFVGAGDRDCVMIAVGARNVAPEGARWGTYEPDPIAAKYGACVDEVTSDPSIAYAGNAPKQVDAAWRPGQPAASRTQ